MPFTDLVNASTATGRWCLLDYAINLKEDNLVTIGSTEYRDTYEKGNDGLRRIKSVRFRASL